ncbi:MAG: DUF1778 domain-containing protein [Verrucomicrobia bacterium]|jgi:uncharacterized protein (DUF1778 family)|nr:MAG: DUF1778 domain-containing protein [Verrucomicrobiota bacterium]
MPDRAKVTSLEAIEDLRAKLVVYRDKARRVLDEVDHDVSRNRVWLENERPNYWQNQIRLRTRALEECQQELFSARLSGLRDSSYVQQAAVQKARRSIRDAEEKFRITGQWARQFDHRVEAPARQVEQLRQLLDHDLGKAVMWLNELIKSLSAYAELSPSAALPTTTLEAPSSSPSTVGNEFDCVDKPTQS